MGSVSIKSVLSLAFAFGLSAFALTASAAPTAKAVWDVAGRTLTFYYDEIDHSGDGLNVYEIAENGKRTWDVDELKSDPTGVRRVIFDESFKAFQPKSCAEWFYGFQDLSYIENLSYLDTSKATSFYKMFSGMSSKANPKVSELDLSHFNTESATTMNQMFAYCSLTQLDLSSFSTPNLTDTTSMFINLGNLTVVYVGNGFDVSKVTSSAKMFSACKKLVGGAGTSCNGTDNIDVTYARIDNPPDAPGYFTSINHPPIVSSVTVSEVTFESAKVTVSGTDLDGGMITVEAISGEETEVTKVAADFGTVTLDGLAADTEYAVKVTAANAYGSRIAEGGPFTTLPLPLPTISSVTVNGVSHDTVMLTVAGESDYDVSLKVELLVDESVMFTKTASGYGAISIEGLSPETTYSVRVTVENRYGSQMDESVNFTTLEKPSDKWKVVLDETGKSGAISWGAWEFGITVKDGAVTVGKYTKVPSSPMPLDFSLPIVDGNGETYVIVKIDTQFGKSGSGDARTEPFPEAEFVSLLTLPPTVTEISNYAFTHCVNLIGTIPADNALKTIGVAAFVDTQLSGDVVLPEIEKILNSAFWGTKITSIQTGDKLRTFDSNYDRGALQKCTCLTNVSFDATKSISLLKNFTFYGCSALEELDLSMVLNFEDPTKEGNSPFGGCASLKKLIFGAVTNLPPQVLYTPALETVVFEGVPPVGFVSQGGDHTTRYLSPVSYYKTIDGVNTPIHDTIFDKKSITTYVHRKLVNTPNEAGVCWADYAANGQIGAAKKDPAKNTTWAAEYVYEGVDLANRQLLTIEPGTGLMLIVR